MELNKETTLGEIVKANYRTAGLLESYNLDFCCRGKRTLSEACTEAGLESEKILKELSEVETGKKENHNFDEWDLDFLIDYIINIHHSYVKKYLPLISVHSAKVREAHGINHPEVIEIAEIFNDVKNELEAHLLKEEKMLFPYIKNLAEINRKSSGYETAPFGTVQNPINVMEAEHISAGNALYKIRELSGNYSPPADACATYSTYFEELKGFEDDLHAHIHLENNILHPKAIELEKKLSRNLFNN